MKSGLLVLLMVWPLALTQAQTQTAAKAAARPAAVTAKAAAAARPPAALSLPDLENDLMGQPAMMAAARYAESYGGSGEPNAAWGWRLFGAAGVSQEKEPQVGAPSRDYHAADAELGVMYPLLGTRAREQATLRASDVQAINGRIDAVLRADEKVQLLRESYISYWASQQKRELTRKFLSESDRFVSITEARRKSGLLRESNRQESLLSFAEAKRNVGVFDTNARTADGILRQILPTLPAQWTAQRPPLLQVEGLQPPHAAERQEKEVLDVIGEQKAALAGSSAWPVDSDISLSYRLRDESDAGTPLGGGVGVRWRFSVPLGSNSTATAQRRLYETEMRRTQAEIEVRHGQQALLWQRALDDYRRQRAGLRYSQDRLNAAVRQESEDNKRANLLSGVSGDALERWQNSRYALYQRGLEVIEVQEALLLAQSRLISGPSGKRERDSSLEADWAALDRDLQQFAQISVVSAVGANAMANAVQPKPDTAVSPETDYGAGMVVATAAGAAAATGTRPWRFYVWKATPVLAGQGQALFSSMPPGTQIWLSFSASEVTQLAAADGKPARAFRQWMTEARKQRRPVHLLLGDPGWLKAGGRESLLAAISKVVAYGFDGIHLDLEPDQLPEARQAQARAPLLKAMADRVREVSEATQLPVGVSLHWRDARADAPVCLLCLLRDAGVSEVTLMVYSSNPVAVAERVLPVLKAYPRLKFSVAQSVEPASVLSAQESYAAQGRARFLKSMQQLNAALSTQPNFSGIAVQSWEDYQRMKDGAQVVSLESPGQANEMQERRLK
ncbi:MAG TPA: hypothetical protein VF050_09060 [Moraxellaceae bacterium]